MFDGGFYDPTLWEKIDVIGNVYNRLVLWQGDLVHSASCYFGTNIDNGRLFQMFFFDEAKIEPAPALIEAEPEPKVEP